MWLGEAKLYKSGDEAVKAAVKSVRAHIEQGFLNNEKLLLGPQVSKWLPRHREIRDLLSVQTSLDQLFNTAVFPVCIACDSAAALSSTSVSSDYIEQVRTEVEYLAYEVENSGLTQNVNIMLIYVPLVSKDTLQKPLMTG